MVKIRKFESGGNPQKSSFSQRSIRIPNAGKFALIFGALVLISASPSAAKDRNEKARAKAVTENASSVLWVKPADIADRNLFYGPGGPEHEPHSTFAFLREDLNGTNPKFDVRDENGVKWRVKLGAEARPETAATRLLWAVGYFSNQDYFIRDLRVNNMKSLKRGQKLVAPDGTTHNVRLKRYSKDEKHVGLWRWKSNPFIETRAFNGLRVMMALMNNWDLKDDNNSIYEEREDDGQPDLRYVVHDLGATFGTTSLILPQRTEKGNLHQYAKSKFITAVHGKFVDFATPGIPSPFLMVEPRVFMMRLRLRWIGRNIPLADARWIGQLLSQLSRNQISQAFQAAGYSPMEVDGFTDVVEKRISELNKL